MSTPTVPVFSESTIVAAALLSAGNMATRGTLDLTGKFGAYILPRIGRTNTTALGAACQVLIRPVIGGSSGTRIHPSSGHSRSSSTAAAAGSTFITAGGASGSNTATVSSGTGLAAGDIVCLVDGTSSGAINSTVARLEWARISKISGTSVTFDDNLQFSHFSAGVNEDLISNGSDVFNRIWVPGGQLLEVIFDFGAAGSGGPIAVEAVAETYADDATG